jgi:hypothetical protein
MVEGLQHGVAPAKLLEEVPASLGFVMSIECLHRH